MKEVSEKKGRKGTIITIGADQKKRIPQVFDTVFKIVKTAVSDEDDVEKDETFCLHTLRTIDVEGVTAVPGKKAVNVNGDFDINLDDDPDETEKDLVNKVFADKEEAIKVWAYLTDLQLERAKQMQDKINQVVVTLQVSKDDRQF